MASKVLIIDDNKMNIRLLCEILGDEGYSLSFIDDSSLAIKTAHSFMPDIILLDIMMPKMDGFQVCALFKKDPILMDIPVIMVTAKLEGTDVKKALELGAFDYIKKPVDENEVIARVHSALKFKENQDKLKEMAMKDSLTGIYNHRLLVELFEKALLRNLRLEKSTSFVMIDIDYFKNINDTYGHLAGDIVLIELSKILLESIRASDILGRYGGEEFGIVLSEIDKDTVYYICERIREKVASFPFYIENIEIHITISVGIFITEGKQPSHPALIVPLSAKEIIKKADGALYTAKKKGRNRIEICENEN